MKLKFSIPIFSISLIMFSACTRHAYTTDRRNTNIQKVHTYWEEVWNKGNLQAVADFYHPNAKHGEHFTIEGFQSGVKFQREAFPDFKATITDIFSTGDKVVSEVIYTGTHTGRRMFGQDPLRKPIKAPGIDIFTFKNGKCINHQHVADHLDVVRGMGIKLAPSKNPDVVKLEIQTASDEYINLVKELHTTLPDTLRNNRIAAIGRKLADDYQYTDMTGRVFVKNDDMNYYKKPGIVLNSMEVRNREIKIVDFNMAIETGEISFNGSQNNQPMHFKKQYTTTWVWRGARWQIVSDHASKTD